MLECKQASSSAGGQKSTSSTSEIQLEASSVGVIPESLAHKSYNIVIVIGHYITLAHNISFPSVATSIFSAFNVRLAHHEYSRIFFHVYPKMDFPGIPRRNFEGTHARDQLETTMPDESRVGPSDSRRFAKRNYSRAWRGIEACAEESQDVP